MLPPELSFKIDTDRINEAHEDFMATNRDLPLALAKRHLTVRVDDKDGIIM